MSVLRYPDRMGFSTHRDPFVDLVTQLRFLTAQDYVVELLHGRHNVRKSDAKLRVRAIRAHTTAAIDFIDQAASGPNDVAFLPGYYAAQNLAKLCILASPLHDRLLTNRHHGATYNVARKDSHSVLTERIQLRQQGTIPLFYEVLTGATFRDRSELEVRDFLPLITDVSHEWSLATGKPSELAVVTFTSVRTPRAHRLRAVVNARDTGTPVTQLRQVRLLEGFRAVPGEGAGVFEHHRTHDPNLTAEERAGAVVRRYLIYHSPDYTLTPRSSRHLLFPEEIPILLLFFYLSSITRYKPDFVNKIRDSRHWPILSVFARHGMYKLLVLFWSYMHQRTVMVN